MSVNLATQAYFENKFATENQTSDHTKLSLQQMSNSGLEGQYEIADKIKSIISEDDKPLAVIISTSHDHNDVFNENKGFFKSNVQQLIKNNYKVIQITDVKDPGEIGHLLKHVEKIAFFCIRGHGKPDQIQFSESNTLYSKEIDQTFAWLPSKLSDRGIIYLESCSTGRVDIKDFEENVQFEFGKLTKNLLKVKIVAPSKDSYVDRFKIDESGRFHFFSRDSYSFLNSIKVLNKKTKKLLNDSLAKSDQNIRTILLESLKPGDCSGPAFAQMYLDQEGLYVDRALLSAIQQGDLFAVKELLDLSQFNPNHLIIENEVENYFLLSKAIKYKRADILEYLLEQGAYIFQEHHGHSPFRFLLEEMYDSKDIHYHQLMKIVERHVQRLDQRENTSFFSEKFKQERENYRIQRSMSFFI